jgi:hypothetical protein
LRKKLTYYFNKKDLVITIHKLKRSGNVYLNLINILPVVEIVERKELRVAPVDGVVVVLELCVVDVVGVVVEDGRFGQM